MAQMPADHPFGILNFGHCDLAFDLAQGGGESFDFARNREPVEPFDICVFFIAGS